MLGALPTYNLQAGSYVKEWQKTTPTAIKYTRNKRERDKKEKKERETDGQTDRQTDGQTDKRQTLRVGGD